MCSAQAYYQVFNNELKSFEDITGNIAYQIDLFGVQYQLNKHFGAWSELGYGNQGLAQLGLSLNW